MLGFIILAFFSSFVECATWNSLNDVPNINRRNWDFIIAGGRSRHYVSSRVNNKVNKAERRDRFWRVGYQKTQSSTF